MELSNILPRKVPARPVGSAACYPQKGHGHLSTRSCDKIPSTWPWRSAGVSSETQEVKKYWMERWFPRFRLVHILHGVFGTWNQNSFSGSCLRTNSRTDRRIVRAIRSQNYSHLSVMSMCKVIRMIDLPNLVDRFYLVIKFSFADLANNRNPMVERLRFGRLVLSFNWKKYISPKDQLHTIKWWRKASKTTPCYETPFSKVHDYTADFQPAWGPCSPKNSATPDQDGVEKYPDDRQNWDCDPALNQPPGPENLRVPVWPG